MGLTPNKLYKDNPHDRLYPAYKIGSASNLPWRDVKHLRKYIPEGKVWRYTAQCGVYDVATLSALLEGKIGAHADVFEDQGKDKSRLFDISFNEQGIPQFESFALSLAAWSAGQIVQHEEGVLALDDSIPAELSDLPVPGDTIPALDSGFTAFDVLSQRLMQWVADEGMRLSSAQRDADVSWLQTLAGMVTDKIFFPHTAMDPRLVCLVKCVQVKAPEPASNDDQDKKTGKKPTAPASDDLLNSFFIHELRHLRLAWQQNDVGPGLAEYISAIAEPGRQRINLRSPEGLDLAFQGLLPTQAPAGAWPSQYPLAFSQQLAVNEIWRRNADLPGIFAINGPPGTGKTTLLRDVVAAVVTERATKLIRHIDEVFCAKKRIKVGDNWTPHYPLHAAIKGSAIVVASANNGAVENISLELPGEDAVPRNVLEESDYFADLVPELIGKPGWGLLAARLGNKGNRNEFMNVFWWRKPADTRNNPYVPPDKFAPERGEGLSYHLNLIKDGKRTPAMLLPDAVSRFNQAQAREDSARKQLIEYSTLNKQITDIHQRIKAATDARARILTRLAEARTALSESDAEVMQTEASDTEQLRKLDAAEQRVKQHESNKPTLLDWISTWGRAQREWWDRYHRLTQEYDVVRQERGPQLKTAASLQLKHAGVEKTVASLERELEQADKSLAKKSESVTSAEVRLQHAISELGAHWPNPHASDEMREKSAPWAHEAWQQARQSLFLTALDVHRSFIESHPDEMITNLNMVSDWLQGKNLPETQAALALDSLSFVVPVISTTFASVPRMFSKIGRETIGWLLIDEAGQALPQQAAGAIWRSARTVVVGDPKQLEPVSGISSTVEGALARHYGVSPDWWPGEVSAQVLADHTMNLGTFLPDPDKQKVWVGCPLRVHRRCDDPMFAVSNNIAYDGLMVHGKKVVNLSLPASCWIDVVGKNCDGNWISEEGEAVTELLFALRDRHSVKPDDIFLISPFKDCARKLWRIASEQGFDTQKTGTVHTTQGKEASIVILVLGGNIQKPGARAWAARRPNLLNVAVSRAKQRLYVIGDRTQWQKQRYFSTLAEDLPESQGF
ncbi:MAG: AAA domain-containing protein [Leclercia sp.]